MIGNRLHVALDYGPDQPSDHFNWQLYTPTELSTAAAPFGLMPQVVCAWWDEARPASPEDARMQIVFERISHPGR